MIDAGNRKEEPGPSSEINGTEAPLKSPDKEDHVEETESLEQRLELQKEKALSNRREYPDYKAAFALYVKGVCKQERARLCVRNARSNGDKGSKMEISEMESLLVPTQRFVMSDDETQYILTKSRHTVPVEDPELADLQEQLVVRTREVISRGRETIEYEIALQKYSEAMVQQEIRRLEHATLKALNKASEYEGKARKYASEAHDPAHITRDEN